MSQTHEGASSRRPEHRAPAVLVLEDGRAFRGESFGAQGTTIAEIVFATGMTGYQETLTDPSYRGQIVVMTAPHIGNTGVNDEDFESRRVWVDGYVVRDPSRVRSSWRSNRSLDDLLTEQGVVGISAVDTRALTRHLRERGSMRAAISSDPQHVGGSLDALVALVNEAPPMEGSSFPLWNEVIWLQKSISLHLCNFLLIFFSLWDGVFQFEFLHDAIDVHDTGI